jgi:hypothetical protein
VSSAGYPQNGDFWRSQILVAGTSALSSTPSSALVDGKAFFYRIRSGLLDTDRAAFLSIEEFAGGTFKVLNL